MRRKKAEDDEIKNEDRAHGDVVNQGGEEDKPKGVRKAIPTALISAAKRSGVHYDYRRMARLLDDHFSNICIFPTAPSPSSSEGKDANEDKDWETTQSRDCEGLEYRAWWPVGR